MVNLDERITVDSGQCEGRPCVRGMCIRVSDVLDLLAEGHTASQIVEELPDLEPSDVAACLRFASRRVGDQPPHRNAKRRFAVVVLVVVLCGLAGFAWGRVWWAEQLYQSKVMWETSDTAELLGQYTSARTRTGQWPEPDKLYGCFFRLRSTVRDGDRRTDYFRDGPDGTWLGVELYDDGRIAARASWHPPPGVVLRD